MARRGGKRRAVTKRSAPKSPARSNAVEAHRPIEDYYDFENENHPVLQQDVPFFLGLLPKRKRLSILELCVGSGRVAIPLAQAGHRVVGVDLSPGMVRRATEKRDAVGLTPRELALHSGDATRWRTPERFDWVCIFFNTLLNFVTLEALDALLQNVRRQLRPGGRFFFDIFQPDPTLLATPRARHRSPTTFYVPGLRRTVFHEIDIDQFPSEQRQRVTFHYRWYTDAGRLVRQRVRFDVTYLFPRELRMLLERNGLQLLDLWGDYDGAPLGDNSPRMIGVCRKARR